MTSNYESYNINPDGLHRIGDPDHKILFLERMELEMWIGVLI